MIKSVVGAVSALLVSSGPLFAAMDQISVAQMPVAAETSEKGELIDLLNEMKAQSNVDFPVTVAPFARSLHMVASGSSSAHLPLLDPENGSPPAPGLAYSSETILGVEFALYHHVDVQVDPENLSGFNLETERSHTSLFEFDIAPVTCVDCTLAKINSGRDSVFLFASNVSDAVIAAKGLDQIQKTVFKVFPMKFVIREGDTEADRWLTQTLQAVKASGRLPELVPSLLN